MTVSQIARSIIRCIKTFDLLCPFFRASMSDSTEHHKVH